MLPFFRSTCSGCPPVLEVWGKPTITFKFPPALQRDTAVRCEDLLAALLTPAFLQCNDAAMRTIDGLLLLGAG